MRSTSIHTECRSTHAYKQWFIDVTDVKMCIRVRAGDDASSWDDTPCKDVGGIIIGDAAATIAADLALLAFLAQIYTGKKVRAFMARKPFYCLHRCLVAAR